MIKEIQREIKDFSRQGQADLQRLVRRTNRTLTQPVTITRRGLIGAAIAAVAVYHFDKIVGAASSVTEIGSGVAAQAGRTLSRIRINIEDPEDPNAPAMKNRPGVLTQVAKVTEDAKTPTESPRTATPPRPSPSPIPSPSRLAMADSIKPSEKLPVIQFMSAQEVKRANVDMQQINFHIKPEQWPVISTPNELLRCINETDLLPQYFASRGINVNSITLGNIHAKRAYSELPAFIASLGVGISKQKAEQVLSQSNKSVEMTFRFNNKLTGGPATMLDSQAEVKRRRDAGERNIFWTGENFWTITAGGQVILIHENCINPLITNLVGENTPTVTSTATIPAQVPPTQPPVVTVPPSSPTPAPTNTHAPMATTTRGPENTATETAVSTEVVVSPTPAPTNTHAPMATTTRGPENTPTSTSVPVNTATETVVPTVILVNPTAAPTNVDAPMATTTRGPEVPASPTTAPTAPASPTAVPTVVPPSPSPAPTNVDAPMATTTRGPEAPIVPTAVPTSQAPASPTPVRP